MFYLHYLLQIVIWEPLTRLYTLATFLFERSVYESSVRSAVSIELCLSAALQLCDVCCIFFKFIFWLPHVCSFIVNIKYADSCTLCVQLCTCIWIKLSYIHIEKSILFCLRGLITEYGFYYIVLFFIIIFFLFNFCACRFF